MRRILCLALVAAGLAGCAETPTDVRPGDLLADETRGARTTMAAIGIVPAPVNEGPSTPGTPPGKVGDAVEVPGEPDRWFHEDLTSTWWWGVHQSSGANNSKYRRDDGRKYEHISEGEYAPHASKYKPDGTKHITDGQWASRYQ